MSCTACVLPTCLSVSYAAHLAFVSETLSASIRAGKRALSTPALRLWTHASLGARGRSWLSRSFLPFVVCDMRRIVSRDCFRSRGVEGARRKGLGGGAVSMLNSIVSVEYACKNEKHMLSLFFCVPSLPVSAGLEKASLSLITRRREGVP